MALFRQHVSFGALVAVVGCTLAYYYAYATDMRTLALLLIVTTIASFLPDLDSDTGIPFYVLFGLCTLIVGGVTLYLALESTSDLRYRIGVPLAIMGIVWVVGGGFFKHLTEHRGMMHSIPAALIVGCATYLAALKCEEGAYTAALLAAGACVGYVSHLILDEVYASITIDGIFFRSKRSLGTALKLFSSSTVSTVFTYITLFLLLNEVARTV